jgi:hypothetical protein
VRGATGRWGGSSCIGTEAVRGGASTRTRGPVDEVGDYGTAADTRDAARAGGRGRNLNTGTNPKPLEFKATACPNKHRVDRRNGIATRLIQS